MSGDSCLDFRIDLKNRNYLNNKKTYRQGIAVRVEINTDLIPQLNELLIDIESNG